jgi:hypothetical protein
MRVTMSGRARKIAFGALAALTLIAFASPNHRADISLQMHRVDDLAPQRIEAVVDIGVLAISVLVTWSKRLTT